VERRAVAGADVLWACSEQDALALQRAYRPRAPITVVPNGVDVPAYRRDGVPPATGDWRHLPITLVYVGLFSYSPNEDAALRLIREVLPSVRARGHDARLVLVGRDPTPALMAEARSDPRIELTGPVQNVLPYLEQPCIVTLPIAFGGGTRLKIVEAFAVGRPVVSSAKGAEGLDAIDGTHLLLREDPAAMAEAVIELWHRPQWRGALCARALELVQRRYSWPAAARRIARSLGLDAGEASCE
jgi:glycosyltransferase involved in cell wall biosynthesis